MNSTVKRLAVLGILLAPLLLHSEATPPGALLILAKRDHSMAIVDPRSLRIVARVPVGEDPHEVVASADGKIAYVSNYGGGSLHTIAVIDLVTQRPLPPIELGPLRGPHGLVFVAGKLWFTAEGAKAIGSYDPETQKIDWVLGTGQNRTHMLFVSSDLKRMVTANVNAGTMSIIDKTIRPSGPGGPPPPRRGQAPGSGGPGSAARPGPPPGMPNRPPTADWDETVVKVGNGPEGFDLSPDGREIWVANAQDGTISILDPETKTVKQTLAANVMGANRLKFTLDGKLVLTSTLDRPDLVIIDAATRKTVKRVKIGNGAAGILMRPDGARAFVACSPDDYVTVIDLKTLTVVGKIEAGQEPDGLAWASTN